MDEANKAKKPSWRRVRFILASCTVIACGFLSLFFVLLEAVSLQAPPSKKAALLPLTADTPQARPWVARATDAPGAKDFENGRKFVAAGDAASALEPLAQALSEAPENPVFQSTYGQALWLAGDLKQGRAPPRRSCKTFA